MRKTLILLLACLLIVSALCSACADNTPSATVKSEPGPHDYVVTEADGGEFRPLPVDLSPGAPVNSRFGEVSPKPAAQARQTASTVRIWSRGTRSPSEGGTLL